MDFFHVWLRRSTRDLSDEIRSVFSDELGPKWNHDSNDGELIDDASRFDGDKVRSKKNYEDGMARAFRSCSRRVASRRAAGSRVCEQTSRCLGDLGGRPDSGWFRR